MKRAALLALAFSSSVIGACAAPDDAAAGVLAVDCGDDCALDFGEVKIGSTKTKKLTIRNDGDAALDVDAVFSSGDPTFTVGEIAPIAPGAGSDIAVTFDASVGARVSAVLTLNGAVDVDVSGTGVCPVVFSRTDCDFGDVDVGVDAFCDVVVESSDGCEATIDTAEVNGGGVFFLETEMTLPMQLSQPTTLRVRATPATNRVSIGTFVVNETTITLRVAS